MVPKGGPAHFIVRNALLKWGRLAARLSQTDSRLWCARTRIPSADHFSLFKGPTKLLHLFVFTRLWGPNRAQHRMPDRWVLFTAVTVAWYAYSRRNSTVSLNNNGSFTYDRSIFFGKMEWKRPELPLSWEKSGEISLFGHFSFILPIFGVVSYKNG